MSSRSEPMAAEVLRKELAGDGKSAKSAAVVRLRRLLRNARGGHMAALFAVPKKFK